VSSAACTEEKLRQFLVAATRQKKKKKYLPDLAPLIHTDRKTWDAQTLQQRHLP
jgi:hypothetical protein